MEEKVIQKKPHNVARYFVDQSANQHFKEVEDNILTNLQSREGIYNIIKEMEKDSSTQAIIYSMIEDAVSKNDDGEIFTVIAEKEQIANDVEAQLRKFGAKQKAKMQCLLAICYGEVYEQLKDADYLKKEFEIVEKDKEQKPDNGKKEKEDVNRSVDLKQGDRKIVKTTTIKNPLVLSDVRINDETLFFMRRELDGKSTQQSLLDSMKDKGNVTLYEKDSFVHSVLYPKITTETVISGDKDGNGLPIEYEINRGCGLLEMNYPVYSKLKMLLDSNDMAQALKNVIVNIISMQCDGMEDDEADEALAALKEAVELKKSFTNANGIAEYPSARPVGGNIYTQLQGETGTVSAQQVGGENPEVNMNMVEFRRNQFYGGFRVIKQKFGFTDDAAGFSGGESLVELNKSYAKLIQTIQDCITDLWEGIINKYYESCGRQGVIETFKIKMTPYLTADKEMEDTARERMLGMATTLQQVVAEPSVDGIELVIAMCKAYSFPENVVEVLERIMKKYEQAESIAATQAMALGDMGEEEMPMEMPIEEGGEEAPVDTGEYYDEAEQVEEPAPTTEE